MGLARLLFVFSVIRAVVPLSLAAVELRTATVVDISGVSTEVTNLSCSLGTDSRRWDTVGIEAHGVDLNIPIANLRSLRISAASAELVYDWQGATHTESGKFDGHARKCSGKSVFGSFELDGTKLRSLSFNAPPSGSEPSRATSFEPRKANLELDDDTKLELAGVTCSHQFTIVQSEVNNLAGRFGSSLSNLVFLREKELMTGIPLAQVRSIRSSGPTVQNTRVGEVSYDWRGQTNTISGEVDFVCNAESNIGSIRFPAAAVRQFTFGTPPSASHFPSSGSSADDVTATVTTASGKSFVLTRFRRFVSWYSTAGYLIGGKDAYSNEASFCFLRGESSSELAFGLIGKLEFGRDDAVTVTLKTGASAAGKLVPQGKSGGVYGWNGESDRGWMFFGPSSVRSISFGK